MIYPSLRDVVGIVLLIGVILALAFGSARTSVDDYGNAETADPCGLDAVECD